jgi:hypothetical protein
MLQTLTRLPAIQLEPDRIVIGQFYQYIDNRNGWLIYESKKPAPKDHELLCLGTRRALQRWVDHRPEIIAEMPNGPPLPDADELNAQVPREQWEVGLSGKPEAPWHKEFIAYALDLRDLMVVTFANHTLGAARAVCDLEGRWDWARALYGDDVRPLLRLSDAPWPTQYGERKRPAFEIAGWRQFRDGALHVVNHNVLALDAPQPRSLSDQMDDENPF